MQDGADAHRYQRVTRFGSGNSDGAQDLGVRAPMSGRVIALPVKSGDRVEANQPLVVMESMKMEMPLCAPGAGVVGQILVEVGSQLSAGQVLMELVAE
ncbi:pyruvate carboxylase [compost metagenome]